MENPSIIEEAKLEILRLAVSARVPKGDIIPLANDMLTFLKEK